MADTNVRSAEDAILAASGARAFAVASLGQEDAAEYMPIVDAPFQLSAAERAKLAETGFFVSERFAYSTYSWAFHELYPIASVLGAREPGVALADLAGKREDIAIAHGRAHEARPRDAHHAGQSTLPR